MNETNTPPAKTRKTPVQERSTDTVAGICEAAVQVLLEAGADRLTTTRVAQKAEISVGSLYQYFPNKQSLLYAVLEHDINQLIGAVEKGCKSSHETSIEEFAEKVVAAFLQVKTKRLDVSRALYALCNDNDRLGLVNRANQRMSRAVEITLKSIPETRFVNVEFTARMVIAMISGTLRVTLESEAPRQLLQALRGELKIQCVAYLKKAAHFSE